MAPKLLCCFVIRAENISKLPNYIPDEIFFNVINFPQNRHKEQREVEGGKSFKTTKKSNKWDKPDFRSTYQCSY